MSIFMNQVWKKHDDVIPDVLEGMGQAPFDLVREGMAVQPAGP